MSQPLPARRPGRFGVLLALFLCTLVFLPDFRLSSSTSSAQELTTSLRLGYGGRMPHSAAVNATTNLVYVTNWLSGTLLVIDSTSDDVVEVIKLPVPTHVAVNHLTNRIYVTTADGGSREVRVIDGETHTVITTIPIRTGANAIAIDPTTNRIYVTQGVRDSFLVIDGETNQIIARLAFPEEARAMAVNPTTNRIYVAVGSAVAVVDGETHRVLATIPTAGVTQLAVNPETNLIYATHSGSLFLSVIDGGRNQVVTGISVGPGAVPVAVDAEANRIYVGVDVGRPGARVAIIDGNLWRVRQTIQTGRSPSSIAVNAGTARIYVVDPDDHTVSVIDGDLSELTASIQVGVGPSGVAVSLPDNRIYVAGFLSNQIVTIDGRQDEVLQSLPIERRPIAVAVGDAGNRLYVTNSIGLSVLDVPQHRIISTTPLFRASEVTINPYTDRIYVTEDLGRILAVLDGTTFQVITRIIIGCSPVFEGSGKVAVNPQTNRVYVAKQGGAHPPCQPVFAVIDGDTNLVVARIQLTVRDVAVNPITNRVYLARAGVVDVLDGDTLQFIASIAVEGGAAGVAVNPERNRIYVTAALSNTVSVIDGETNREVARVLMGRGPAGVAVNPETDRVYVVHPIADLVSVISDGPAGWFQSPQAEKGAPRREMTSAGR